MSADDKLARVYDDDEKAQCLAMIAAGNSMPKVSRETGVPIRTLYRWKSKPLKTPSAPVAAAAASLASARAESLSTAAEGIRLAAAEVFKNIQVLIEIRDNPATEAKDRIRAIDLLNGYAGVVKQERVEVRHEGSVTFDVSELRAKIRAAREAAERENETPSRTVLTIAPAPK